MIILGIESSCDDTSVALLDITDDHIEILAEKTASQIDVHKKYGGVVPEIAGRKHAEKIVPLVEHILEEARVTKPDVIAVTSGPGLITGLVVGVETAKTLSYLWDVPIVGVNHIEGHIHSVKIPNTKIQDTNKFPISNFKFPVLSLIASGGHTELILSKKQGEYERIGSTVDDAAGECFDKVAKLLGFDYPGGPKISKFAETGNPHAIEFPRPMIHSKDFNFSFAGLKTAALYWLRDNQLSASHTLSYELPAGIFGQTPEQPTINDFCSSFEQAIIDVLVTKTLNAAKKYKPKTVILGGGVSANKKLRETLQKSIEENFPASSFFLPLPKYAMDNAAMIAVAAYHHVKKKEFTLWQKLQANPNWKIY
ncbi:MAG: tRNA (adenosine(37)-N6)-threonylcarbamoyltransferase complex transferase subunit TsaD [Candidatus Magasanikbacteria bacterium]